MRKACNLDDLDRQILRHIGNRISPGSISEILRPFRNQMAYSSLWERIRGMERQGLLVLRKQQHYVLVELTEEGRKARGSIEMASSPKISQLVDKISKVSEVVDLDPLVDQLYHELFEQEEAGH